MNGAAVIIDLSTFKELLICARRHLTQFHLNLLIELLLHTSSQVLSCCDMSKRNIVSPIWPVRLLCLKNRALAA
ncbi:hypothetical protein AOQ71_04555 [Bradyrhizobium manausense]|uniref:Uncharacterized protein n=1 Tax=Bradyrhizobium manausense TaxID=989370 RepID=A0A0R3E3F0_9BRAD|nr:hypothetical protein AOQ71_04555 [Bradyrhizobium manausense]